MQMKRKEDHACRRKEKKTMHADEKKRITYTQMKRKETMHADEKKRRPCMQMTRKDDHACR